FIIPVLCPPPSSTLFPYTTLFRSHRRPHGRRGAGDVLQQTESRDGGAADSRGTGSWRRVPLLGTGATAAARTTSGPWGPTRETRSEEHTSELQSRGHLVCRLLLEK